MNAKHINITKPRDAYSIKAYVINPDNDEFVELDKWENDTDPTRAEFVVAYDRMSHRGIIITKHQLHKDNYETAQKVAAEHKFNGWEMRCPSREDCAFIYDARCNGLDDALELIGGDNLDRWIWTSEIDPDPEYSDRGAFVNNGESGGVYSYDRWNAYNVRPVLPFTLAQ